MRKVHKERLKGVLAVLLIAATFACGYYWENYGRQQFTYTDIIVFKEPVAANTEVKRNMLGIMKVENTTLIEDAVTNPESIIGKETANYIPCRLPLTKKFFTEAGLSTGSGKYNFKIPEQWIYSFPQTLRRGDKIYIYAIPSEEKYDTYAEGGQALAAQDRPLFQTKVAYVKDSANREVLNVANNRYDGTSTAAQIEIIITEELYNVLCKAHEAGYSFNILYV